MKYIVITGANRGLGLEFTRQYLGEGASVIATYRNSLDGLESLKKDYTQTLIPVQVNVSDEAAARMICSALPEGRIDLLIQNAGIYPKGELKSESWLEGFRINCIAPIMLTYQLLAELQRGNKDGIALISSKMGSIEDNSSGESYQYRSSKAALNAAGKSLALDLKQHGIPVIILHPGWVQTDMGGAHALITPEQSISGMRKVIAGLTLSSSGQFIAYDGAVVPW
ncbi:MAG: SDR family oxidoreductase [Symploca sp. SIO2G7]|nr:SDR family oxidoreductase [Symploca sp. SIO2G7]